MLERDFQRKITNRFKDLGWETFKIHGHAMQRSGWPDMFVCGHGLGTGVWIELKTDNGTVSTLQQVIITRMRQRGVPVVVLRPSDCVAADIWRDTNAVVGAWLLELAAQQKRGN